LQICGTHLTSKIAVLAIKGSSHIWQLSKAQADLRIAFGLQISILCSFVAKLCSQLAQIARKHEKY